MREHLDEDGQKRLTGLLAGEGVDMRTEPRYGLRAGSDARSSQAAMMGAVRGPALYIDTPADGAPQ